MHGAFWQQWCSLLSSASGICISVHLIADCRCRYRCWQELTVSCAVITDCPAVTVLMFTHTGEGPV
jgi:hypothetical protein